MKYRAFNSSSIAHPGTPGGGCASKTATETIWPRQADRTRSRSLEPGRLRAIPQRAPCYAEIWESEDAAAFVYATEFRPSRHDAGPRPPQPRTGILRVLRRREGTFRCDRAAARISRWKFKARKRLKAAARLAKRCLPGTSRRFSQFHQKSDASSNP